VLGEAGLADDKRYKAITAPIRPEERGSWRHSTKEAGEKFFQPRSKPQETMTTKSVLPKQQSTGKVTGHDFSDHVKEQMKDVEFCTKHEAKGAPLAMLAFAKIVMERIVLPKIGFENHFNV
jgi:hypothetical protein